MKPMMVALVALAAVGCSRNEGPAVEQQGDRMGAPSERADDTSRNVRDKDGTSVTAEKQSDNQADRSITQQIRRQVVNVDDMSTNGKNVKIVTSDGVVTLRGPVETVQERAAIGTVAMSVDGVRRVDNQLEVAAK
jgi:hyperosmotically inducible periplasmic protein